MYAIMRSADSLLILVRLHKTDHLFISFIIWVKKLRDHWYMFFPF